MPSPTTAAVTAVALALTGALARLQAPSAIERAEAARELLAPGLPPDEVIAAIFQATTGASEPCHECHEEPVTEVISARLLPHIDSNAAVRRGVMAMLDDPRGTPARDVLLGLWSSDGGDPQEPIRPSPRLLAGQLVQLLRDPPGRAPSIRYEVRHYVLIALDRLPRIPPLLLPALRDLAVGEEGDPVTDRAIELLARSRSR